MKHLFKTAIFIFIGLFLVSCSNDDPLVDPFVKNVNAEKFTELEIGKDYTISNGSDDVHINFEYAGKSKVTKIIFDVDPVNVTKVNKDEVKWELKNHVVPAKHYSGKKNPHVHYHFHLEDANDKKIIPAEGTYSFRITVEHEDKSKSYITKEVKVLKGSRFEKNIHEERFTQLEIGNSKFVMTQSNSDIHINFQYTGTNKVTKILFDVIPYNVEKVNEGEIKWKLENYLLEPIKSYQGKLDPKIHYHLHYNKKDQKPKIKIAEGVYKFRITVEHEDGSKSAITKDFTVIKKFNNIEVGEKDSRKVKMGSDELHVEYEYVTEANVIEDIIHRIWFEEWREGQKNPKGEEVKKGKWNYMDTAVAKKEFQGMKNPKIHGHVALLKEFPKGSYYFTAYIKEKGEAERVVLDLPFIIE